MERNHTLSNWTSICQPGWSNVGHFHYPPTDPQACIVYIKLVDSFYVLGFLLSLVLLPYSLFTIAKGRGKPTKSNVICVSCTVYSILCMLLYHGRLTHSHEDEILGRDTVKLLSLVYPVCASIYWPSTFLFMNFYVNYLKRTSGNIYGRCKRSYYYAQLSQFVGTILAVTVTYAWYVAATGGEENITVTGIQCAVALDVAIVFGSLVAWPLASLGLKADLQIVLHSQKSHSEVEHRAQKTLLKIKMFTIQVISLGGQSIISVILIYLVPDYSRTFPYQVPLRIFVVGQGTLLTMVYMVTPTDNRTPNRSPASLLKKHNAPMPSKESPSSKHSSRMSLFSNISSVAPNQHEL